MKDIDLPTACHALLEELLISAGILGHDGASVVAPRLIPMKLIDLGFGCGDQTIYLTQELLRGNSLKSVINESRRASNRQDDFNSAFFSQYIGITIDPTQFSFTHQRLSSLRILDSGDNQSKQKIASVQIFCADAAKPAEWSNELKAAVKPDLSTIPDPSQANALSKPAATWILALDTLYHFSPSRRAIFNHAFSDLHASIVAFDLLLADETTFADRLLLRLIARLTGAPYTNFLTTVEYKAQLATAGYATAQLEIRDVSEHVFEPLAAFLHRRDRELRMVMRQGGIGPFRVFAWVLAWWGKRGVVRGCIVVARR